MMETGESTAVSTEQRRLDRVNDMFQPRRLWVNRRGEETSEVSHRTQGRVESST